MHFAASLIWAVIGALIVHFPLVFADLNQSGDLVTYGQPIYCKKEVYGSPNIEDCKAAMYWIPYFEQHRGHQVNEGTAFRTFAEPQFLQPPFSGVKNGWAPRAIIQMPKIWRKKYAFISSSSTLLVARLLITVHLHRILYHSHGFPTNTQACNYTNLSSPCSKLDGPTWRKMSRSLYPACSRKKVVHLKAVTRRLLVSLGSVAG